MGTNYYLQTLPRDPCDHCGREYEPARLHIGKSAVGWNFALRIYPLLDGATVEQLEPFGVEKIEELDDWRPLFDRFPIFDQYDRRIAASVMIDKIANRRHPNGLKSSVDADPHRGWTRGIGGTYDLCVNEFS